MTLVERIKALTALGQHLQQEDEYLQAVIKRTEYNNPWFTVENQNTAIQAIATEFLAPDKLQEWLNRYDITEPEIPKTVGLVLAGNIPLVGFHDILCVFVAGHKAKIKLSDKDKFLLPYLLKVLKDIDPRTEAYFKIVPQLKGFDAVIATGSNNSARYFEAYFGKYPNIIRKNRNGIAILDGEESTEELKALGQDVFQYFGLGCRNVSKLYVPRNYNFEPLLESLHEFRSIILHSKYKNNFDYNYALHVLNKAQYMANGCIILVEDASLTSRIASLHYEYYEDNQQLEKAVTARKDEIQCVVSRRSWGDLPSFAFGKAQEPALWDYADGVDTLAFLMELYQINK